jgi:hypothetical protein
MNEQDFTAAEHKLLEAARAFAGHYVHEIADITVRSLEIDIRSGGIRLKTGRMSLEELREKKLITSAQYLDALQGRCRREDILGWIRTQTKKH